MVFRIAAMLLAGGSEVSQALQCCNILMATPCCFSFFSLSKICQVSHLINSLTVILLSSDNMPWALTLLALELSAFEVFFTYLLGSGPI
jgi:hypothetical protein